jgi:hypothetical protein
MVGLVTFVGLFKFTGSRALDRGRLNPFSALEPALAEESLDCLPSGLRSVHLS